MKMYHQLSTAITENSNFPHFFKTVHCFESEQALVYR